MFFIHSMWASESQRHGKRHCTPFGFALHVIAEIVGSLGLLALFIALAALMRYWYFGKFPAPSLWLLSAPFVLGLVSEAMFRFSWWLALRKSWHYDFESREASWIEAGKRRTYGWQESKPS